MQREEIMDDDRVPPVRLRDAVAADAPALAELTVMAGHGLMDIFYGGLIAGKSPAETIVERRILRPGGFSEFRRWRVAENPQGRLLGAVNSFPYDVLGEAAPDPLLTPERLAVTASLDELESLASGSYHINIIAVFPERRGAGTGAALIDDAVAAGRRAGFRQVTVATFEADARLVGFYRRLGFEMIDTRPIDPHPALDYGGNWALLGRSL